MCFFGGGGRGPQSKADIAAGGYRPSGSNVAAPAGNPNIAMRQGAYDSSTPAATVSKQTADRNTIRRADSYGSRQAASKSTQAATQSKSTSNAQAVQGGKTIMSALNSYNKANNKKTILGS